MRRIATLDDIGEGLDALCRADPRLGPVRLRAGEVPLRLTEPGFPSLVSIIVALAAGEDAYRQAGLSRPKQRTLDALATAVVVDGLDLTGLCTLDAAEAIARLTAISGIGPWTAEVYLLSSAGHPDVFPSRDVALQSAVGHALGLEPRPGEKALAAIAESWSPWRGVASRLFWAYYREIKGKEGAPPSPTLK